MRTLVLLILAALPAAANESGLPVAHSGGFGESTCSRGGCHRLAPSPSSNTATVRIEAGAYVPGSMQQLRVIIESGFASRWGFQVTARVRDDSAGSAGTFEPLNMFTAVRCADGAFAPCSGSGPQYVTHTSVGTNAGGRGGRQIYGFNWMPPASDVGPVDFAVAALASNNDRGTNGDFTATASTTSLHAPTNSPMIRSSDGVLHAAALSRAQQTVAPKQLLSIFGSNLNAPGAFIPVTIGDFDVEGRMPRELGKLSFEFITPGDPAVRVGRIAFVGENQANVQAPDFPAAAETIRIQPVINRGGGSSEIRGNVVEMPVRRLAPGLFTFGNGSNGFPAGRGSVAAVNGVTGQIVASPESGIAGSVRARPGDIILLFGSGFGPTSAAPGEPAEAETIPGVTVMVGNVSAEVLYAGTAPTFVGLQQFNVRVPNLPPGNHDLFARVSGFVTQEMVFLPVGE